MDTNFRKRFGVEDMKVDRISPGHGPCCTCQTCGHDYDNCRCQENACVEMCEYVEALERKIAKLTN